MFATVMNQRPVHSSTLMAALLTSLMLWHSDQAHGAQQNTADAAQHHFISHMQTRIQSLRVRQGLTSAGRSLANRAELVRVYDRTGYTPIWTSENGWNRNAERMLDYLQELPRHGLDPRIYHLKALDGLREHGSTLAARIHSELLLSDALISLSDDLARGASTRFADSARGRQLLLRLQPNDDPGRDFDALLPQSREYWALSSALKNLLTETAADELPPLQGHGVQKPGSRDASIVLLRARLQQAGEPLPQTSEPELFDEALSLALMRFQQRNGLDADGLLGPASRQALNRNRDNVIELISANLERWRQSAPEYADSHVRVNIAAQQLEYVYQGQTALQMPVIVGREDRPTPSTQSEIRDIIFNPYWNVPTRIAVRDKLPQIRENPSYLQDKGFVLRSSWQADAEVVDPLSVDWSQVNESNFRFHLRQDPGPQNALGAVKFMFPNDYAVYLHDTPGKALFQRGQRLFSSGCVRLSQPMALAQALLDNHADGIGSVEDNGTNQRLRLHEPVPVHLEYWTAWVDHKGQLQLRNDVYQRDESVLQALRDNGALEQPAQLIALAQSQMLQMTAQNDF